jgi:hypothetical protein
MKRPIEIALTKNDFKAVISLKKEIFNGDRLVDIYIAPTIVHLVSENNEKPILPIDLDKRESLYKQFNQLTYSIGKLIRLAELSNYAIKDFVNLYLSKNNIDEITNRNSKCRELKKYQFDGDLTFMQLKQVFSCIVKTDKCFDSVEELISGEKRNIFTKQFDEYIYDRDCYVHGTLYFFYPEYIPILKVKPPNKKEHYVSINEEILWDNLLMHKNINTIIDKMRNVVNKNGS